MPSREQLKQKIKKEIQRGLDFARSRDMKMEGHSIAYRNINSYEDRYIGEEVGAHIVRMLLSLSEAHAHYAREYETRVEKPRLTKNAKKTFRKNFYARVSPETQVGGEIAFLGQSLQKKLNEVINQIDFTKLIPNIISQLEEDHQSSLEQHRQEHNSARMRSPGSSSS